MATLNSFTVIRRHNRPSPNDDILLELYNSTAGTLKDPYAVRSVHIFPDVAHGDSSYWLNQDPESDTYGTVNEDLAHTHATMIFSPSGYHYTVPGSPGYSNPFDPDASGFSPLLFDPNASSTGNVSGIFKLSEGHLAVTLCRGAPIAGAWRSVEVYPGIEEDPDWPGSNHYNWTDAVGKYFDIWTIQIGSSPNLSTFIHSFSLTDGNTITFTEPLLVTTRHSLVQKYVNNNSIVKLQITSEHTINNTNIPEEIKNIFKDSVIGSAKIRIVRISDTSTESVPFVLIHDFDETLDGEVGIDSDDTISFLWDTTSPDISPGTYQIQVESQVFDETIRSDPFTLILR